MKLRFRRFVAFFLICCLSLATALPAFAESVAFSPAAVEIIQSDDIYNGLEAPTVADESGNLVDSEYTIVSPEDLEKESTAPSVRANYFGRYARIVSVNAPNSSSRIIVNIEVGQKVPDGAHLQLGYEYPASYRQPAMYANVPVNPGRYTITLNRPNFIGKYILTGKFTARQFVDKTTFQTLYYYPSGKQTEKHLVTEAEGIVQNAAAYTVAALPALLLKLNPKAKLLQFVAVTTGAWKLITDVFDWSGHPLQIAYVPKGGNYIVTTSWYDQSGYHCDYKVYDDQTCKKTLVTASYVVPYR